MEVFNKLYSQVTNSVSSTVSQLSGVLPGNPVTREFDATAHVASAGPGLLWKVYKGCKRSTKQEASIFVFEKRQLDRWSKNDREIILEKLRRGVTQLTKIRHPQILTVQHPLEESRESLAFATEPVFASLANLLGKTMNMPQPANLSDYKFYDIEIKYGLLQIGEGLAFLHNDMKLLHKNISPESIIINQQGVWKIFGLDFCVHNTNPVNSTPHYPYEGYCPTLPQVCQPNMDYMAPECVLNQTHSPASDMFSIGMLIYVLNSPGHQAVTSVSDIQQFRSRAQALKNLSPNKLQCISDVLREHVRVLLSVEPERRLDAHQFIKISYFDDVGVKTLNYLDSLLQWDNLQKSQFYKGLPEALPKLPHRVKVQRVLSCLVRDLAQPAMVPFLLPPILDIAKDCTQKEYCNHVLPHLKPVMKLMEPIQILLIFLQKMELLLKLTPAEDVQQHVLPMLYRGLDSDTPQIHELCLSVLPTFAGLLDHSNVKNSLLPRIKKLCLSTSSLSVRVNCLLCIGRLLENLDKWLVLDEVLPFLPQIPSREPAVLMGILGIYKLALNHKKLGISKEIIATRILPFLIPLSIENGLTLAQFNALVALIKQMFQMVEMEHRTKLEQLNSVRDQQSMLTAQMPGVVPITTKPLELEKCFDGLGLENFVSNKKIESNKCDDSSKSDLLTEWNNTMKSLPPPPSIANPKSSDKSQWNQFQSSMNQNIPFQNTTHSPINQIQFNSWNGNQPLSTLNRSMTTTPIINQSLSTVNRMLSPANQSFEPLNQSFIPNNNQMNWNVLDNLLPNNNTSNNCKLPINQMMNFNQPLLSNQSNLNSNVSNNSSKQLSNDDIMDLLS